MPGFLSNHDLEPNRIEQAIRLRRAQGKELFDLTDTNPTKNGIYLPPELLEKAAKNYWISRSYSPDPKGLLSAREAIVRYYRHRWVKSELSAEQIFITASTSEAYSLLFSLLCDAGDNIMVPQVSYPLFEMLGESQKIALCSYQLEESNGWEINQESLRRRADSKTRAVLLVSPHNPLGCVEAQRLSAIAELGLPIICDEVFCEFTCQAAGVPVLGSLYPDLPVFHLNGISKMLALPDLKLGWIALNGPAYEHWGKRLELLNDLFLSANSLVQTMLPSLLEESAEFRAQMHQTLQQRMHMAVQILGSIPEIDVSPPQGTYFLFPRLSKDCDEEEFVLGLVERGVLVHPGFFYGAESGTHFMVSCLVREPVLRAGLEILVDYVRQIGV